MPPFHPLTLLSLLLCLALAPVTALALDSRFAIDLNLLNQGAPPIASPVTKQDSSRPRAVVARKSSHRSGASGEHHRRHASSVRKEGLSLVQTPSSSGTGSASYHLDAVRLLWPGLVPVQPLNRAPISVHRENFSLSIDPNRYVILPATDGGRILLDPAGEIPPMVRSLVEASDPSVHIVTESPEHPRSFYRAILSQANFYSVTENFSLEYGADPKLTVTADFLVERNKDSLLDNDLVLLSMNSGSMPIPASLKEFLRREGYTMATPPSYSNPRRPAPHRGVICQVEGADDPSILADRLLNALSLPLEKNCTVDIYEGAGNGISLSIKADRMFRQEGQHFVIATYKGDPIHYTLMRLLETQGYRVIILNPKDDFPAVSEKILGRLRIPSRRVVHNLIADAGLPYGISMSGFMVTEGSKKLFLTDREIPALHQELLNINGYKIVQF